MNNLIQESLEDLQNPNPQDIVDPHFDSRFSSLCLYNNSSSPPTVAVAGNSPHQRHRRHCSCCHRRRETPSSIPMKRRSPTSSFSLDEDPLSISDSHPEPKPKRLFLDHDETPIGFSKIDLPLSYPLHSLPPLRRTVSDPVNSDQLPVFSNSSLPPLPLRRTVSEPIPSLETVPGKVGDFSIKEDSPESKKLKRMKEQMKEMNQWLIEVMKEHEHEEERNAKGKDNIDTKENEEKEETVGVERVGDSLEIQLKCQCGKGFQILLSGTSCFYKLL